MSAPNSSPSKTPAVIIRSFAVLDVPSISAILMENPGAAPWSPESLQQFANQGNGGLSAWVAEHSGKVVAFVAGHIAADEFEILNLAVLQAYRRRGIASELVEAALDFARFSRSRQAYLEVRASNVAAIALYAHHGFIECGRRPGYYRDPVEDALLFSRSMGKF